MESPEHPSSAAAGLTSVGSPVKRTRTTPMPWVTPAKTGWSAKKALERGQRECHHCREELTDCKGCGDPAV